MFTMAKIIHVWIWSVQSNHTFTGHVLKILTLSTHPHFQNSNFFPHINSTWNVLCVQSHEHYEEPKLEAVRDNNMELVQDILRDLTTLTPHSQAANELACILKEPHFQVQAETVEQKITKYLELFHLDFWSGFPQCLFYFLQSLLETHDSVASKSYETPPPSPCAFMDPAFNNQPVPPDAVRMVGIRKVSGEHLVRPELQ